MRFGDKTAQMTVGDSGNSLASIQLFLAGGANMATTGGSQATLEGAAKELGIELAATPAGETSLGTFEHVMKINLTGVFFPIQVAKPQTKKVVPRRQI